MLRGEDSDRGLVTDDVRYVCRGVMRGWGTCLSLCFLCGEYSFRPHDYTNERLRVFETCNVSLSMGE